jgi:hypothetical protein
MAIRIPIITDLEDKGIRDAKRAFGDFKTAVGNAEGGLGKFKAGAGVVLDQVAKHAGAFALAGAAAFATFAAKGTSAFINLAQEAGRFSTVTGLTTQEASRWLEVAGDLNVESASLEKSINKMNVQAAKSPSTFKSLGVEIAKTAGGAVNANETFLNVIDRLNAIKDPAERAKVATQLLGKGWQDMAELVGAGSDKLRERLKDVADVKVISPGEVAKAREFRDNMDDLKDASEEFALSLGESVLPPLVELLKLLTKIGEIMVGKDPLRYAKNLIEFGVAAYNAGREIQDLEASIDKADEAWKEMLGNLNQTVAFDNLKQKIAEVKTSLAQAYSGDQNGIYKFHEDLAQAAKMVYDLATAIGVTQSQSNTLRILVDTSQLQAAESYLRGIQSGLTGKELAKTLGPGFAPRASGGPVSGNTPYLVGERGPELFVPRGAGDIRSAGSFGGGTNITVNVNGGDPDQVVAAIQKWVRNNGAVPMTTTTAIRR